MDTLDSRDYGALLQRVHNMESVIGELRGAINSFATKLDERGKTPWGNIISACGVTMGVVAVVGSLAMSPIRDNIVEINADYKYLTRSEVVPRAENVEKWRANEKDIDNLRQRIVLEASALQRQVDELRTQYGNTYNARDVILQMQHRIDKLEGEATGKKS